LTGNSKGQVDVYRSYGLKHALVGDEEQKARLQSAIKKNDFSESDSKPE
jgi:hypothetical protein